MIMVIFVSHLVHIRILVEKEILKLWINSETLKGEWRQGQFLFTIETSVLFFIACWLIQGRHYRCQYDTSGLEARRTVWSEKESNFLVDSLCKRSVIFSSINHAVPCHNGHHMLQPLFIWTQGLTAFNLTSGADKTNGQSVNSHNVAMKKGDLKIFISSQGSAKVKTTACLYSDMKPISLMELSKCHKKHWDKTEHTFPAPFLADGFSNQQALLFWSLKQQGWLGWPSCWLLHL